MLQPKFMWDSEVSGPPSSISRPKHRPMSLVGAGPPSLQSLEDPRTQHRPWKVQVSVFLVQEWLGRDGGEGGPTHWAHG